MRAGLSVLALLAALLVVWLLSGRQLLSVQGSASAPAAAQQQADKVRQAIEQGAAARASEAAAQ